MAKRLYALITMFAFLAHASCAAAQEDRRDKVKAVFLYKFFDYVTWPPDHDPIRHPPATICTMGTTPFAKTLRYLSRTQHSKLNNQLKAVSSLKDATACHILFFSQDSDVSLLKTGIPRHILTVSDRKGFSQSGGMIELRDRPEKMELIVNLNAVRTGDLTVNSALLSIAEVLR